MTGSQAHYSITSSARSSIGGGKWRPIALAVLKLTNKENLVGSSTGISLGVAFLSNLSTYERPKRRQRYERSAFQELSLEPKEEALLHILNLRLRCRQGGCDLMGPQIKLPLG